jgi:predicted dehydrogenase
VRFLSQDLGSGELRTDEAPVPSVSERGVVVHSLASLVSAGTERMLVDFGRASLVEKARSQPDRVRQVVDKAIAEGVTETLDAVRSKLAQPIPLGYANAGVVVDVGGTVRDLRVGDVVASNGPHAELVSVPATMTALVPAGVDPEQACFASVASVALQGIRLAEPQIGERVAVTGLGLIGLMAVQLLRAQGCEVLGIDPDERRRSLAEALGASATSAPGEAAEAAATTFSRGRGVDAVLICASTKSSDPVRSAARMCRQRGRMVLVGVTGLELDRSELYEKELSFQVSSSYGPGRYDPSYEGGRDYPHGLVRWTAGRNMEAVLDLISSGRLDPSALITHRYDFTDAADAYTTLVDDRSALGIVLRYPTSPGPAAQDPRPAAKATPATLRYQGSSGGAALIGAGNYASRVLAPAIRAAGGSLDLVVAPGGVSAALLARQSDSRASSKVDDAFADPAIAAIFLATRHDSHSRLVAAALRAGKAVYVEKPLAITDGQLDDVITTVAQLADEQGKVPVLTVGFNRRFAPVTLRMRELLATTSAPKAVVMTVNAGAIPPDHWTQDPEIGGGRIVGEGCHFIDLARHLVGSPIADVTSHYLGATVTHDTATLSLTFVDGSTATIHYVANGSPRFPKERIEVFCQGRVLVNDNFRSLKTFGWPRGSALRLRKQDKGHQASVAAFLAASSSAGPAPIAFEELVEVSRATLAAGRRT